MPVAAMRISASLVISCKSWVLEWAMVTVALASSSIKAIGLPTKILLPTTTAFLPCKEILYSANNRITPAGVQLRKPFSPRTNRPRFTGWSPSASLSGAI